MVSWAADEEHSLSWEFYILRALVQLNKHSHLEVETYHSSPIYSANCRNSISSISISFFIPLTDHFVSFFTPFSVLEYHHYYRFLVPSLGFGDLITTLQRIMSLAKHASNSLETTSIHLILGFSLERERFPVTPIFKLKLN